MAAWLPVLLAAGLAGCVTTSPCDRACVSQEIQERSGRPLGPDVPPETCRFAPQGPLNEDQAIAFALWNNPAFNELLVDLKISQADLLTAGLLPNPEFVYYWPAHLKPMKYLIDFPLESLWLRNIRVAAAGRENDRVCRRLVQSGLDLIRDVRQAYADVLLAQGRLRVAEESVNLRRQIAQLAEARLKAGDIGPQEEAAARIDALLATQEETRARAELPVVAARLRNLLGLDDHNEELVLDGAVPVPKETLAIEPLLGEAMTARPDVLATEKAVEAAAERLRLAKMSWFRVLGLLDATSGRQTGHEVSPAVRFTVPIFHRGEGGIARAEAELERAVRNRNTVQHQALFDVRRSFAQYQQSRGELEVLEGKVLPEVEQAIDRARRAYREGNASYLIVLESTRQLLDTRLRQTVLQADLRRFWAELERSVGRKLPTTPPAPAPGAPEPLAEPAPLPPPMQDNTP